MRRPFLLALTLLATLPPRAAGAQRPSASDTLRLSLPDAVRGALDRAPAYRKTVAAVDAASAGTRRAWAAFLPSLSAGINMSGNDSRAVTGEDDFGRPRRLDTPEDFRNSSTSQSLSASLDLFDGLANVSALRAARADADAANATAASEALRLRAEVAGRYYQAVRARRVVELERRLLASARERLAGTEAMLRVARTDPADVLGARVDVAAQQQAVARAEGEVEKADLALAQAMGEEPGSVAYVLTDDFPADFDADSLPADRLLARALSAHPALAAARADARAASARAAGARGGRWPRLSLNAGLGRSMSLTNYGALGELNPQNRTLYFGLSASLPLFDNLRTSAAVAAADVARTAAEQDLRAERFAVEAGVRSALVDLRVARGAVTLAEQADSLSRERIGLAQRKYELGALSFTELQTLIDRAAAAERQAVEARYGWALAVAALEEAVGGPVVPEP